MKNFREIAYIIHIIALILAFKVKAFGQTGSLELTCKTQAKEVALQRYQSCVTEARQQQIDSLRKEYQVKMNELKEHYNKELKKAAGKEGTTPVETETGASIQLRPNKKSAKVKSEKATKSVAKSLPRKQSASNAIPVQTVAEETTVVQMQDNAIERESIQMEQEALEIVESSSN